jgi:exopolysaccharide biosynthesis polyprenyl glycosylphosphotransferase
MMSSRINIKKLFLLLGDYLIFHAALVLTLFIRYGSFTRSDWDAHSAPFALLGVLWVASFYVAGLYDLIVTRDQIVFFRTYLEGMIANLAIAFAFFYMIPIFGIAPRTNLILHFVIALLLGYAWRLAFNRLIAPSLFQNRVLFVGSAIDAIRVQDLLMKSALGLELVAVVETSPGARIEDASITWYTNVDMIDRIIREKGINTIVIGHRPDDIPGLRESLYKTLFTPVSLIDRATLEESVTGRVPLEYVSQTWFLEHLREGEKAWFEAVKRLIDVLLAIPFGLVTLLIYPFTAAIIKLSSSGPVLYSQIRVGKNGRSFRIWKFRTMRSDAEKHGPQFTADAKTDPRIFPAGRIIRQLRIDELPQIWNVLHGDLSLIGPRPERPEFVDQLVERMPYYALRHLTRPGLTGWAQVRFLTPTATVEDNLTKLQYDLYYIKHRSLLLDATILLRTIGIVLKRQGT